ncbi:MAG: LptF/LptG family permease [Flavobacteriales bacterium]|nr:LptF/LptG family permease [Flavobacteriales bacterium]
MKILDRYIFKSFLLPFLATFFVVLLIFVLQILWLYADDIIGKGIGMWTIVEMMAYLCASMVPMALPVAILLSSIMAFGNLSENSELTAFKSAGIPLSRIMRSLIVFMAVMAYGAFLFANHVIPYANFKSENMLYNIVQQKPALNLESGVFTQVGSFSMRVNEKIPIGDNLDSINNVLIHDLRSRRGAISVIVAKTGSITTSEDKRYMLLTLYDGNMYDEDVANSYLERQHQGISKSHFDKQILPIDISSFSKDNIKKENQSGRHTMLNISQLRYALDSLKQRQTKIIENQALDLGNRNFLITLPTDSVVHASVAVDYPIRSLVRVASSDSVFRERIKYFPLPDTLRLKQDVSVLPIKYIMPDGLPAVIDTLSDIMSFLPTKVLQKKDLYKAASSRVRDAQEYLTTYSEGTRNSASAINLYGLEIQRKFSLAFSVIVLFFVGAPLGALIRKGGFGLPVVVAIGIFMVYNVIFMMGEKLGKEGTLDVISARWLPTWILLPFGIWLTYRATHDAAIVNLDPLLCKIDALWARVPQKYKDKLKFFKKIKIKRNDTTDQDAQ